MTMQPQRTIGIIGWGSIGQKHFRTIREIDPDASIWIVTRQTLEGDHHPGAKAFVTASVDEMAEQSPDAVIVATPASEHHAPVAQLIERAGQIIIEKPVSDTVDGADHIRRSVIKGKSPVRVAYNLRYLEGLKQTEAVLDSDQLGRIMHFSMTVGQSLNQWRPGREIGQTVSAQRSKGGGVLRELSHELDLAIRLFGRPSGSQLMRGRMRFDDADVEDTAMINAVFTQAHHPVMGSLQLDFTREDMTREITITGDKASLKWNLLRGTISLHDAAGEKAIMNNPEDIRQTHHRMWDAILNGGANLLPEVDHAALIIRWIEDMENQSPMITPSPEARG